MRLLIIDDDREVGRCLANCFEMSGHSCEAYTDPGLAVRIYRLGGYDAVLTDVMMPEMNGIEVLEHLRGHDPEARVIIMTGFAELDQAIAAVNAGAYAFFRKPLEMSEVEQCLQRIQQEILQSRQERDLGEELVKLCAELRDFERSIQPARTVGSPARRRCDSPPDRDSAASAEK